jgi:acyl-coenzyme A thioesterase PaaI-like protein
MVFYTDGPGRTRAEFSVPETFQGYRGIVHGGVVAAILDEAAGRTVMGDENPRRVVVTGRMDIRYRKPVPVARPLIITGELVEEKGPVVRAYGKISDQQGSVLAEADVTLVEIPGALKERIGWEPADWRVYQDREEG